MAHTQTGNIVIPQNWANYIYETSTRLNAFIQSGVMRRNPIYDAAVSGEDFSVRVPYLKPAEASRQVPVEGQTLNIEGVSGDYMIAPNLISAFVLGATDLASNGSGEDLMTYIRTQMATNIVRNGQDMMVAILKGLFNPTGGALYGSHCNDISEEGEGVFSMDAIIDTATLLGDASNGMVGAVTNMQVVAALMKLGVVEVEYVPNLQAPERTDAIYRLNGKRLIIDDSIAPTTGGVHDLFMFGAGAFGYGAGVPSGGISGEMVRDALKDGGNTALVQRAWEIIHPQGLSFTGTPAVANAKSPSNADLANAANWSKKFADKNIKIVALKAKLEA